MLLLLLLVLLLQNQEGSSPTIEPSPTTTTIACAATAGDVAVRPLQFPFQNRCTPTTLLHKGRRTASSPPSTLSYSGGWCPTAAPAASDGIDRMGSPPRSRHEQGSNRSKYRGSIRCWSPSLPPSIAAAAACHVHPRFHTLQCETVDGVEVEIK